MVRMSSSFVKHDSLSNLNGTEILSMDRIILFNIVIINYSLGSMKLVCIRGMDSYTLCVVILRNVCGRQFDNFYYLTDFTVDSFVL